MKQKSKVFNTFKKWKVVVENEIGLKIKFLKSNNGGEYSSFEFVDNYAENGIRMLKTIPKTLCMRVHAGLPKALWAKTVSTTTYLTNRRPSIPLGFKISEEEWQGKDVSLSHLKVFGCVSYVRVRDVDKDKLDLKARK